MNNKRSYFIGVSCIVFVVIISVFYCLKEDQTEETIKPNTLIKNQSIHQKKVSQVSNDIDDTVKLIKNQEFISMDTLDTELEQDILGDIIDNIEDEINMRKYFSPEDLKVFGDVLRAKPDSINKDNILRITHKFSLYVEDVHSMQNWSEALRYHDKKLNLLMQAVKEYCDKNDLSDDDHSRGLLCEARLQMLKTILWKGVTVNGHLPIDEYEWSATRAREEYNGIHSIKTYSETAEYYKQWLLYIGQKSMLGSLTNSKPLNYIINHVPNTKSVQDKVFAMQVRAKAFMTKGSKYKKDNHVHLRALYYQYALDCIDAINVLELANLDQSDQYALGQIVETASLELQSVKDRAQSLGRYRMVDSYLQRRTSQQNFRNN